MLIGHGPAGYLVGAMADRGRGRFDLILAGLAGGLAPDLDAVGYHVGIVQGFHRATPLHWPSLWAAVLVIGLGLLLFKRAHGPLVCIFALSALLHCGLDMTMAPLYWGAPFHWHSYEMVHVPGGWSPYWLGFIFYWTFLPEIALWIAAIFVWRRQRFDKDVLQREPINP